MVLNFIEKYKFAILGTVLLHVAFVIYSNFVTVKRPFRVEEPVLPLDIPIEDMPIDPEIMKMLEDKQNAQNQNQDVYNVTSDANDSRDKSYDNFSTQDMDEQVYNNTKALEQQYFDEWASTHGDGGNKSNESSLDIQQKDKQQNKQNQNNVDKSIDTDGNKSFAGDVMASFDLKDRKAHALEKPGYTCNSAGTVMLEIKVDKNGSVRDVTYLPSGSSNATECMIEQSIKYAKRSRFNYSDSAPAVQTGTITYKFVSK
ncbi:MAG: hypothetical protein IPM74_06860 [Crocinitomicaceae bacterium]|nr:hypothetical protein [Crocinitomicaceae bacterium]